MEETKRYDTHLLRESTVDSVHEHFHVAALDEGDTLHDADREHLRDARFIADALRLVSCALRVLDHAEHCIHHL